MSMINLKDSCVACLAANRIMESVYSSLAGRKIFDMMKSLLPTVEVIGKEGPSQMCMLCKNNLIIAYDFQQMLIQSDEKVKMIVTNSRTYENCDIENNSLEDDVPSRTEKTTDNISDILKESSLAYKCTMCHKCFSSPSHLARHSIVHTNKKSTNSTKIDKNILKSIKLKSEEINDEHVPKHKFNKQHVCDHCHKSFAQKSSLKEHVRTHFPHEKPFLCPICGQAFHLSSSLRHHVQRHGGEKKFACNYCPSKFMTKGGLTSHLLCHTEKKFICTTCNKAFAKSYSLSKHLRTHTNERPYPCDSCTARFNSNNHLKRHIRTHTGEKPYKCSHCSKDFSQSSDLVKHTRIHIGNTYKCDVCSMSFRLFGELKQHKLEHYRMEQNKESTS